MAVFAIAAGLFWLFGGPESTPKAGVDADDKALVALGGHSLAPKGSNSAMPAFWETRTDHDIWAVLSFIHSRWPAKVRERQRRINTKPR